MLKSAVKVITAFLIFSNGIVNAQNLRSFAVENGNHFQTLNFTLTATSGSCQIKPGKRGLLDIYGTQSTSSVEPEFKTFDSNNTRYVNFQLKEPNMEGVGKVLSSKVFNSGNKNNWNVLISEEKNLNLNLNYVIGDADVDLSGLPVETLKIKTGSANVNIGYPKGVSNPICMDTLLVEVDLGSVKVNHLDLSNASTIMADVGFGSLTLDFGLRNEHPGTITASVGAGSLEVIVPSAQTPVIIHLNNSPLCHVKLDKSFRKLEPNIYVSNNYRPDAPNLLSFDLDVAMGNITFRSTR